MISISATQRAVTIKKHEVIDGRALSTGATVTTALSIAQRAIGDQQCVLQIPLLAVMQECVADQYGVLQAENVPRLQCAIRTPMVLGGSVPPQGYTYEPFISEPIFRHYTQQEIVHLRKVAGNHSLPDQIRGSARMALAGRRDISTMGVMYLGNVGH